MRIGILTQNYLPEPDPKMHILASGLRAKGHEVVVLTAFPNYPQGVLYPGYRQKLCSCEVMEGVEVVRMPVYPDRSRSVLRRSLNYLSFPMSATVIGPWNCRGIDILHVYHPPITLAIPAIVISWLRNVPFVFEIQDMWPETLVATGMVHSDFMLRSLGNLALLAYRKAAAITVISPGFKQNLVAKGVPENKIHVFYNWAYEGTFELQDRDPRIGEEFGLHGKFNVLYAGNMGPAQGLSNLLEAAGLLQDESRIQFLLMGSGIERESLMATVAARKLSNIRFLPPQPMGRMPEFYAWADAVLVHLTNDPLFRITIPGKTQSSLLSGRPIIVCVAGDAADLVNQAGAGIPVAPQNPPALAEAVRTLFRMDPADREAMGKAGRRYYDSVLSPGVAITRYETLFLELIAKRNVN